MLGWQNSATVGSVVSYNLYWIAVSLGFVYMAFKEKRATKGKTPMDSLAGIDADADADADDHAPLLANPAR